MRSLFVYGWTEKESKILLFYTYQDFLNLSVSRKEYPALPHGPHSPPDCVHKGPPHLTTSTLAPTSMNTGVSGYPLAGSTFQGDDYTTSITFTDAFSANIFAISKSDMNYASFVGRHSLKRN